MQISRKIQKRISKMKLSTVSDLTSARSPALSSSDGCWIKIMKGIHRGPLCVHKDAWCSHPTRSSPHFEGTVCFFTHFSACRAAFMVKIIESIKRNASPEKQRDNSLPAMYFSINSHINNGCYLPKSLWVNYETLKVFAGFYNSL